MFRRVARRNPGVVTAALVWFTSCGVALSQDVKGDLPAVDPRIVAALARPLTVDFVEMPLDVVVRKLELLVKIPFRFDTKALADAGIGEDTTITLHVCDVRCDSLLDLLLEPLDGNWMVRDHAIVVTTKTEAENDLELRYYPIAQLVRVLGGGDRGFDELRELVTSNVEPHSWDETGGPGTIRHVPNLLVVHQTRHEHEELEVFLRELEQAYGMKPRRAPRISPSLDAIQRALDAETSFDFNATPLDAAAAQLAKEHGISLVLDTRALADAGIPVDTTVTARVANEKLKNALRTVLSPFDLTSVIVHDVLWITTKVDEEIESRKFYHIDDLIDPGRPGAIKPADLAEFVTATVKPESWDEAGGPATIAVLPRGVWIIWQTELGHEEVASRLAELREAMRAGEVEARELPKDDQPVVAPKSTLRRTVYQISGLSVEDVVKAIQGSISRDSWDVEGGEGSIQIVHLELPPAPAADAAKKEPANDAGAMPPVQATPTPPPHVLLVVCQTSNVHREIVKLLQELGVRQPLVTRGWRGGY